MYDPTGRSPETLQLLTPVPLALRAHDTVAVTPLIFQLTVPVGELAVPALVSVTVAVSLIVVP